MILQPTQLSSASPQPLDPPGELTGPDEPALAGTKGGKAGLVHA